MASKEIQYYVVHPKNATGPKKWSLFIDSCLTVKRWVLTFMIPVSKTQTSGPTLACIRCLRTVTNFRLLAVRADL